MNKEYLRNTQVWVREELDRCVNFWLENGMDKVNGGVYTCLDRTGRVYSTDKSVWMQGRCGWIFAYLCHLYGTRPEWLEASKSCLDFLEKYCINPDADGRMYFTVTADDSPIQNIKGGFSAIEVNDRIVGRGRHTAVFDKVREVIHNLCGIQRLFCAADQVKCGIGIGEV